jgi:glutamate N-acetyltransferase/amino-acid N-acetyltransferase
MSEPAVTPIEGGVTAPDGFRAAGVRSGLKANGNRDLAMVVADKASSAAGVFTTNLAMAAPILVSRDHLSQSGGTARAIVANSGCANACTGSQGMVDAREMAAETARHVGCAASQVLVASTGVIGVSLRMDAVRRGISDACASLSKDAHAEAAQAIMTTDPFPKAHAVAVETPAGQFRVGGMAKGSGMIGPQMATMLAFLTTDARVPPGMLHAALVDVSRGTFNAITVDGESSTNDCVFALSSGLGGVDIDNRLYPALVTGLEAVARVLALGIVRGGEGATKTVTLMVTGASSDDDARVAARVVANSLLVKTAIHGADPNWGRLVAAAGRAGVPFDIQAASVSIGGIELFSRGVPHDDLAPQAAEYLKGDTLEIVVDLGTGGNGRASMFTCDLSAGYVRVNAAYRT